MTIPRLARAWACALLLPAALAHGYENDVHFGLTRWLALQAGFDASQAVILATGNARVDSGRMDSLELNLELACTGRHPQEAAEVQARHYPAGTAIPAAPAERAVQPGSREARAPMADLLARSAGKEELLLMQFGGTLHVLQDSWSHAGVPGTAAPGAGLRCDPAHDSSHPATRGGPGSHDADLTHRHPQDVLPMAEATYRALTGYPVLRGQQRKPAPWASLTGPLEAFAQARTKTAKRAWFVAQGVADTGFLEGVSLPDGPDPGPLEFTGRHLPTLKTLASTQHETPADVLSFYERLLTRWLSPEPVTAVAREFAPAATPALRRELAARLGLWKLRDHGSAAALLHRKGTFGRAELAAAERLIGRPGALLAPAEPAALFMPVIPKARHASPVLAYIVRPLPGPGPERMLAMARMRHAPYDTIAWIIERAPQGWSLVDVVGTVDH